MGDVPYLKLRALSLFGPDYGGIGWTQEASRAVL